MRTMNMRGVRGETESLLSDKFCKKWMKLARHIALDNDTPCSRKVGSVVVDQDNIVIGIGYNGVPRQVPHCDSAEYITDILWDRLNETERILLKSKADEHNYKTSDRKYFTNAYSTKEDVGRKLHNCNQCPRRLLEYKAGERTDLCDCQHAERNVISNTFGGVAGGILFNWSCVSCRGCTGALINARIKECHFLEGPEYEQGALWMYEQAKIPVFLHSVEDFQ